MALDRLSSDECQSVRRVVEKLRTECLAVTGDLAAYWDELADAVSLDLLPRPSLASLPTSPAPVVQLPEPPDAAPLAKIRRGRG